MNDGLRSYNSMMKKMKRDYKAILLSIAEIPNIGNNKVIMVANLEELANMALTIKKFIYYIECENCCDFILLDGDTYYVYTLRVDNDLKSLFDKEYRKFKMQDNDCSSLLDDLDNTAIIKINNGKCFRVSPIN